MVKEGQKMRKGSRWDPNLDKKHTIRMKSIIKKYGWSGKNLVGEKASDGAWLLVQHADHDINFQERCLKLIKEAVKKGEAKKFHFAYLKDRILVNKKRRQVYGTQFYFKKKFKYFIALSYIRY